MPLIEVGEAWVVGRTHRTDEVVGFRVVDGDAAVGATGEGFGDGFKFAGEGDEPGVGSERFFRGLTSELFGQGIDFCGG